MESYAPQKPAALNWAIRIRLLSQRSLADPLYLGTLVNGTGHWALVRVEAPLSVGAIVECRINAPGVPGDVRAYAQVFWVGVEPAQFGLHYITHPSGVEWPASAPPSRQAVEPPPQRPAAPA